MGFNPMPNLHTEIEYKFSADSVDVCQFLDWAWSRSPVFYETDSCPDVYYVRGKDSVRHRWSNHTAGELTVKRRTSKGSLTEREEIDLFFDTGKTSIHDVNCFLLATGWERLFTLFKSNVHVFAFEIEEGVRLFLSIYSVEKYSEKKQSYSDVYQFIEVEVEKGSSLDSKASKKALDTWKRDLKASFKLAGPLNASLFEIFSGRPTKTKTSAT